MKDLIVITFLAFLTVVFFDAFGNGLEIQPLDSELATEEYEDKNYYNEDSYINKDYEKELELEEYCDNNSATNGELESCLGGF